MASPLETTETQPIPQEEYTALQLYDQQPQEQVQPSGEELLSSCIITQSPSTEIVNTTTTTSTITEPDGRVKKLKTTTTTTLRTTTTVRRVRVVAPSGSTGGGVPALPPGAEVLPTDGGTTVIQAGSALPPIPGDGGSSEMLRLTHVSGDEGDLNQPRNFTQVTFMKPQTQTSEVVEVQDGEEESVHGKSQPKTTTKTVRKRVTTSVSAVFASRHTKVDSKGAHSASVKDIQGASEDGGSFLEGSVDLPNEDSAAMTALRECERQFATRLDLARNPSTTSAADGSTTIVDRFTSENGKTTTTTTTTLRGKAFPSLFDGLPLYQGYGMISQRAKDIDPSETPVSIFFNSPLEQIDVASLTKMFEEATKSSLISHDLNSLFGDISITPKPALEGQGVEIEEVVPSDTESGATDAKTAEDSKRKPSVPASPDKDKDADAIGYKNQILIQLASKTGPCRIAWSEMPEVLAGNIVSTMSRHEIQLQEAMFEVITSEASYYRSLQVLIEHFYSAPEFDCSRSATTDTVTPDTDGDSVTCQTGAAETKTTAPLIGPSARTASISSAAEVSVPTSVKPVLSPTEKHHLFSNVLLICMASERFLKDLEARWSSQKPLLNEVCDLIVKHAGSVYFEPYLTYLRNQTYQVAAYRRLNRRDDFQKAIARMHALPAVGKNRLDSFLALPMQRLTRLKLLVEVIQKLQSEVAREAEEKAVVSSTETMTAHTEAVTKMKITKEQLQNTEVALKELKRLLSESETEKKLMEEKARLLALSSGLEFPENVKRIAISDKRLIKEGELKSANSDGKAVVLLKKLGRKKPETFYLILFHDLLMVTKLKKSDRYLVIDYCPREKVYVTIGNPSEVLLNPLPGGPTKSQGSNSGSNGGGTFRGSKRQKRSSGSILSLRGAPRHHTTTPEVPEALFKQNHDTLCTISPSTGGSLSSASSHSSNMEVCENAVTPSSPPLSPSRLTSVRLKRSGSSLSSKSVPSGTSYPLPSSTINRDLPLLLYIYLTESQSGSCSEFCLTTNDNTDYEAWYRALHSKALKNPGLKTEEEEK